MESMTRRTLFGLGGKAALAAGAVGMLPALAACGSSGGSSSAGDPKNPVRISYQYPAYADQNDLPLVQAALDAYLAKLAKGFRVTLQPVQNYDQKMTLNMSAGSVADLFFTASWTNNYFTNVGQGNLLALDDLLPTYAPKLWASMPQKVWQGARVKGKIYGAINQQRFPKLWGVTIKQELADKYSLDVSALTDYASLEPFLRAVKAGEPNTIPWATDNATFGTLFYPEIYGWDPIATEYGLAVKYDDPAHKVFNVYATDEYKATCELMYKWRQEGLTTMDPLSAADRAAKQHAGGIAAWSDQAPPTNPQLETFATVSKSFVASPLLNTDGVASTLTAVNVDSSHPEAAVEFMELLNTDVYLYNLICFGIEGKDYVFTDKADKVVGIPSGMTANTDPYNPNADWQFGDQFNAFYRDAADAKAKRWVAEAAVNSSAVVSKALGFSLDTTSLRTQIATVTAAITQYQQQAAIGLANPAQVVPTLLSQMNAAGSGTVLAAAQQQIDAWAKS
jgi:putative aldouronate transport system substrate-binding protein